MSDDYERRLEDAKEFLMGLKLREDDPAERRKLDDAIEAIWRLQELL